MKRSRIDTVFEKLFRASKDQSDYKSGLVKRIFLMFQHAPEVYKFAKCTQVTVNFIRSNYSDWLAKDPWGSKVEINLVVQN